MKNSAATVFFLALVVSAGVSDYFIDSGAPTPSESAAGLKKIDFNFTAFNVTDAIVCDERGMRGHSTANRMAGHFMYVDTADYGVDILTDPNGKCGLGYDRQTVSAFQRLKQGQHVKVLLGPYGEYYAATDDVLSLAGINTHKQAAVP